MVKLTKMNGSDFYLNPHLIERIEERPDTVVITMGSQIQYIVKERVEEIMKKIVRYRKNLNFESQE